MEIHPDYRDANLRLHLSTRANIDVKVTDSRNPLEYSNRESDRVTVHSSDGFAIDLSN